MKVERFLERLDKSREVDDAWRFLVDRFSRFRNVEVTGNAVHLVGPSGDSVATVIRSDGEIVVHDYTPMLSPDENRVNKSFYVKVKDVLKAAELKYNVKFKVLRMYPGWRGTVETSLEELFS